MIALAFAASQSAAWFDTTLICGFFASTFSTPLNVYALVAAVGAPCTIAILLDLPLQDSTTACALRSPMSTQSAPTNTVDGCNERMLICTT